MSASNAAIIARLGLDASEFKRELGNAVNAEKRAAKELGGGLKFERENKAERNIVGLSSELIRAGSAADVLGSALGRLPDVFESSLLVGAVGGVAAAIVGTISKTEDAFHAARKAAAEYSAELSQVIKFGSIGDLDQQSAGIPKQLDAKKAELASTGTLVQILLSGFAKLGGAVDIQEKRFSIEQEIAALEKDQEGTAARRIAKEEDLASVGKLRAQGLNEEAEKLERQMKLTADLDGLSRVYTGSVLERLKALKSEEYVLDGQARMQKEIADAKATAFAMVRENALKAKQDEEAAASKRLAAGEESQKVMSEYADEAVTAQEKLEQLGETGQQKQIRLLEEWRALREQEDLAALINAQDLQKIRAEALQKQLELGQAAIALSKENAAQQEAAVAAAGDNDVMREELQGHKDVADYLRIELDYEQKILQAKRDGNTQLAAELTTQKNLTLEKQRAAKVSAAKFTLSELVAEKGKVGRDARKAKKLDNEAEEEAKQGHLQKAANIEDKANKIKEGIPSLKDEDKKRNPYREAIDAANVKRNVAPNRAAQIRAVGPLTAAETKASFKEALEECQALKNIDKNTQGLGKVKP
jgi:hypothetical protein